MRSCGQRSLYLWLKLSGYDVTYAEVLEHAPVCETGTPLSELALASRHWFAGLKILKANGESLDSVDLPAIAHVWLDDGEARRGHYMVILKVTPDRIVFADASLRGRIDEMPRRAFYRIWSGYLLTGAVPTGVWLRSLSIVALPALALLAGLLCLHRLLRRRRTAVRKLDSLVPLSLVVIGGCNAKMPESPAPVAQSAAPVTKSDFRPTPQPLTTSARRKNLGVVRLGDEARAVFTVANATERTLELRLGAPTCGCLRAELGKDGLEAGESAELELVLRGGDGSAGPTSASVDLGTVEPESRYVFFAEAVVEGMRSTPYSMRLPADLTRFSPEPVSGEIVLGAEHSDTAVSVEPVECQGAKANAIEFGEPVLSPLEKLGSHARFRFQIPVRLTDQKRPATNAYPARIVYHIGDRTDEHFVTLNVFPRSEEPMSGETSN